MTRPLLIFDLDGTLVDSRADIAASLNVGLRHVGAPMQADETLYSFIGKPLLDIFVDLLDDRIAGHVRSEAACEAYRRHYFEHCADRSSLYPGVRTTLERLAGRFLLAVATTKKTFMAERVVECFGLTPLFDAVFGTDGIPYKPDPALLNLLLERFRLPPEYAIMIGDTKADMLAAQRARLKCGAVLYGIGAAAELTALAPAFVLEAFDALPASLLELGGIWAAPV